MDDLSPGTEVVAVETLWPTPTSAPIRRGSRGRVVGQRWSVLGGARYLVAFEGRQVEASAKQVARPRR